MPPAYVKAYVKRGKTDAADAEAICEAVTRPSMRFVPVKVGRAAERIDAPPGASPLIRQRTMLINALRGHLAEFGIVVAQGVSRIRELHHNPHGREPGCSTSSAGPAGSGAPGRSTD